MTDLNNTWTSWGEAGEAPPSGFFYEGGDRVNEKHLDHLWDNSYDFAEMVITAITDRTDDLFGDIVLDTGAKVTNAGGRTINISSSPRGAYVNGQRTGAVSSVSITLNSNSTGSTRTDTVWLKEDGSLGRTTNTTTAPSNAMKLAEVDVTTSNTISAVRNVARDLVYAVASENAPSLPNTSSGFWYDRTNDVQNVYIDGNWREVFTQDSTLKTADQILADDDTVIWNGSKVPASVVEQGAGSGLDADTVDGQDYADIQSWVNNNADVPNADFADDADTVDGLEGGEHPQYQTTGDVPTDLEAGTLVWIISEQTMYVEDGT